MKVKLVVQQGRKRVREIHLRPPEAVLGRGTSNAVRIPSGDVSRKHCRLRLENGIVTLEDLDSVNGTFLNGEEVRGVQVVRPGDCLEVGPVRFLVEYELTPDARDRLRGRSEGFELVEEEEVVIEEDKGPTDSADPVPPDEDVPTLPKPERVLPDDDAPWQLPDAAELRDILLRLDEEEAGPDKA
jgi:pSer/pThr/pTyr-binding forkhead associated (FHA) protein